MVLHHLAHPTLSLSLSLSLSHTHTHTLSLSLSLTHSPTSSQLPLSHTLLHTLTLPLFPTCTYANSPSLPLSNTHTHTHYHSLTLTLSLFLSEHFGRITSTELLRKIHLIPQDKSPPPSSLSKTTKAAATDSTTTQVVHMEIDTRPQTAVERLAYRFNQVRTGLKPIHPVLTAIERSCIPV